MTDTTSQQVSEHTTAIIGVGNIGGAVARHLVRGGNAVVLASNDVSNAQAKAAELGPLARGVSVEEAIAAADTVVLALWLDAIKGVIPQHEQLLQGKVVVDPTNPIAFDEKGQSMRTLPDGQSAGSIVAALLPLGAHYVNAFGTLRNRRSCREARSCEPRRAALFYATDCRRHRSHRHRTSGSLQRASIR